MILVTPIAIPTKIIIIEYSRTFLKKTLVESFWAKKKKKKLKTFYKKIFFS